MNNFKKWLIIYFLNIEIFKTNCCHNFAAILGIPKRCRFAHSWAVNGIASDTRELETGKPPDEKQLKKIIH